MNKPKDCKKIMDIDILVCKNLLGNLNFKYSDENNDLYNRSLFFHGVDCEFIVNRFKIKDSFQYKNFINFSQDILGKLKEMYGPGKLWNIQLARMKGGAKILPHVDIGIDFALSHRIHIPLVTNENVTFTVDEKNFYLDVGSVYEINNTKLHSVVNNADYGRIHIVFDYVGDEYIQYMHTKPKMKLVYS